MHVDVRPGGSSDPLRGAVRLRQPGERDVDVMVGRDSWQEDIIRRAQPPTSGTNDVPVVDAADLVLLKLYAGGSQDRWDIEQLLAVDASGELRRVVDERIPVLPSRCRTDWTALRGGGR